MKRVETLYIILLLILPVKPEPTYSLILLIVLVPLDLLLIEEA
jgi:hypothetical protein